MSSLKKEIRARKQGTKSSSRVFKKEEVAGPDNGLLRWLRSHTPHLKASPSETEAKSNAESTAQKPKKSKKHVKKSVKDDAARIKMRVRYFLNIITREQNLIDAYSADGWKGQSLEKIRPEQELKRAETQILQSKLKIRQELQQLHNLSLEGSIQDSAFDSDGQIFCDDIFCAICKSKEVYPENDIILCDGACNRAFHQFCLDPPLRTEDIPPGDDGWLCPACDSKFDCLDAINDNFGTDFKMEDNWEEVFAEAENDNVGDNLIGSQAEWPSEDSEDDDYNPGTPKPSEHGEAGEENGLVDELASDSGSDSDSDSSDEGSEVEFFDEFAGTSRSKKGRLFEDGEAEDVVEEHMEADDAVLVSGKRQRVDVDYKQLYDEVYGANASDYESSEDEDWGKKKQSGGAKKSPGGRDRSLNPKQRKVKDDQDSKGGGGTRGRKSLIQLPEDVVANLQEMFKECELPSKARKQTIASQLGVPFEDVSTWFKNARRASARKRKSEAKPCLEADGEQQTGKQDSLAVMQTTGLEVVNR